MTRTAVMVFQKENGLNADGIVGVQTRAHIFAKDCAGLTLPTAAPVISSITPAIGTIGSTVTINGSGFTSSSIVYFSIGSVPAVVGNGGTTLTFTVPEYIGPYCKPGMACLMYAQVLSDGNFNVSVENTDGTMSNTVQFTITGKPSPFPITQ